MGILTKTATNGKSIRVEIQATSNGVGAACYMDDQPFGVGLRKFPVSKKGFTHYIYDGKTMVGFTADEAQTISAAVDAAREAEWARKAAELEAAVPGITEIIALDTAARNESERYSRQFNRMMEDESNDGASPPLSENMSHRARLSQLLTANPRAALYLKAKNQNLSAHWADNTGSGAAGARAMDILASGGSIEDATAALAHRRDFVD